MPTPLRSHTAERASVEARGATLDELLADLDRSYPGMRFRIVDETDRVRRHIKLFVGQRVTEDLAHPLAGTEEVHIVCALSGG